MKMTIDSGEFVPERRESGGGGDDDVWHISWLGRSRAADSNLQTSKVDRHVWCAPFSS